MESSSGTLVSLGIAMLPMLASLKRWNKKKVEEISEAAEPIEQDQEAGPADPD